MWSVFLYIGREFNYDNLVMYELWLQRQQLTLKSVIIDEVFTLTTDPRITTPGPEVFTEMSSKSR